MAGIIFIGALHDDPSGMERIQKTFHRVTGSHIIDFLAVEWAEATYTALVGKRHELEGRLSSCAPFIGETLRFRFSNTLGYEADLFRDTSQGCKRIWLLNGYARNDSSLSGALIVEKGITAKIINLTDWLFPRMGSNISSLSDKEFLRAVSNVYIDESRRLARLTESEPGLTTSIRAGRDSYMYEQLQNGLAQIEKENPFGVIIIGAGHLIDIPGSLYNLCLHNGFNVERIWPHEQ